VLDQCVDAILKQVALLRRIAGEFSSFASSPPPRIQPAALPDLFEEVLEPYRAAVADRIGIDVHSASDLPEVAIDRTLFARALTNVIENALHAMPGNGRLTITADLAAATASPRPAEGSGAVAPGANPNVHSPSAERFVIVEVADTGVGIDPEALAKIFEPYFSTKATGTGLGMTIAKRNVELVGGSIAIRSELGAGTSVTMTLPVARREQAPPVPQD
jgi:signal transduction histidine kinase